MLCYTLFQNGIWQVKFQLTVFCKPNKQQKCQIKAWSPVIWSYFKAILKIRTHWYLFQTMFRPSLFIATTTIFLRHMRSSFGRWALKYLMSTQKCNSPCLSVTLPDMDQNKFHFCQIIEFCAKNNCAGLPKKIKNAPKSSLTVWPNWLWKQAMN